jgi:hypothetical protein
MRHVTQGTIARDNRVPTDGYKAWARSCLFIPFTPMTSTTHGEYDAEGVSNWEGFKKSHSIASGGNTMNTD